jgi:hypothetical protein
MMALILLLLNMFTCTVANFYRTNKPDCFTPDHELADISLFQRVAAIIGILLIVVLLYIIILGSNRRIHKQR